MKSLSILTQFDIYLKIGQLKIFFHLQNKNLELIQKEKENIINILISLFYIKQFFMKLVLINNFHM